MFNIGTSIIVGLLSEIWLKVMMQISPLEQMFSMSKDKQVIQTHNRYLSKIGKYWWKSNMAAGVYIVKN